VSSEDQPALSYEELLERCERLEKEHTRRILAEQEVITAKNRVDEELARFKVIQRFVNDALLVSQDEELIELALEAVIEAFECETAAFLVPDASHETLKVIGEFGLPDPPDSLPYVEDLDRSNFRTLLDEDSPILEAWGSLELVHAALSIYSDPNGKTAGAIIAGNTADGVDTYEPFAKQKLSAFTVLVGQAGSLRENLKATEHIRQSEERNRTIIEQALDAVVTVDSDGFITNWNQYAETTFGWTREEILGRNLVNTIIPPGPREAHEQGMQRFRQSGEKHIIDQRIEVSALNRDGEEFPIELAISTAQIGDEVIFTAFLRDITERKLAEERLKKQVESLREELDEAQQSTAIALQTGTASFGEEPEAGTRKQDWSNLIAVHSFRGGTGKSYLTTQLATLLAAGGMRVGILDLDVQSPGIHLMFGLNGQDLPFTLNDFISRHCGLKDIAYNVTEALRKPVPGEVWLIPASTRPGQIAQLISQGYDADQLQELFSRLMAELKLDKLIIDTHPGINEEALLAINNAHHLLIVLRPDTLDYEGTGLLVQVARKLNSSNAMLVANQTSPEDMEALQKQLENTFETPVAAIIPYDEQVAAFDGVGAFVLEQPEHTVTQAIRGILKPLTNVTLERASHENP
jgi:PAS domain S-box-containing protein